MNNYFLRCISCKKEYEPRPGLYFCEKCGPIMGTLEVIYAVSYTHLTLPTN